MWDAQIEACTSHYRVLRYDKRAHGDTDVPDGPYSFELLTDDVLALLDAPNMSCTHWRGGSLDLPLAQGTSEREGFMPYGLLLLWELPKNTNACRHTAVCRGNPLSAQSPGGSWEYSSVAYNLRHVIVATELLPQIEEGGHRPPAHQRLIDVNPDTFVVQWESVQNLGQAGRHTPKTT
jgi:hypothetical protein